MRKAGLFILASALAACGNVVSEPTAEELGQDLSSSFGGETTADEQPAFGEAAMQLPEYQAEDAAVADTSTDRPELRDARHVRIAVMWGYPRPHPEATEWTDWSGSISVSNAGLRVLRTLRFEESDVVVRPRTDIHVVEFESQTKPAADGLLLDVVIAPALNPEQGPIVLSFDTGPYSDTLTLQPGMRLDQVRQVDDAGHVVAYHIIRPDSDGCAEGFLRGRWQAAGELAGHKIGRMLGRFVAHDGRIRGQLRGVFGVRENGKQVWFAKVIDRDGKFLGLLAGRWGEGKFAGLLFGRDASGEKLVRGMVHGMYFEAPAASTDAGADGARAAGGFFGRYTERCGEDPREGMPSDSDEPDVSLDASM